MKKKKGRRFVNFFLRRPQDEPEGTGRVVVSVFPTRKPAISDPSFARAAHIFLSLSPLQDISRSIHVAFLCPITDDRPKSSS